jgi:hypothetical protein
MAQTTGLRASEIRRWHEDGDDHWFDSEEALDLNIVNEVIE